MAFVRAIGLRARDVQRLTLADPAGTVIAETRADPLDRDKAQWMVFSGVRRPSSGWRPGSYTARYTVERAGATALDHRFSIELKP